MAAPLASWPQAQRGWQSASGVWVLHSSLPADSELVHPTGFCQHCSRHGKSLQVSVCNASAQNFHKDVWHAAVLYVELTHHYSVQHACVCPACAHCCKSSLCTF